MDDHELLRDFVQTRSEDAFSQLVERHLRMVLSTARRMSSDDHLAQDVTQNVFTTLAQKARDIRPPQVVGGWLYNTTRNLAMHAVRGEQRRREREEAAVAMQAHETESHPDRVLDQLEPAMAELDADDRDTLVLRYLEDRNLRAVGAEFGISEDAARMKANRALERLRTVLDRKGVSITSVLLGSVLVSSTSSAPAGLAAAITTTAIGGTLLTTATITTMNWLNAKAVTAIIGAAIVASTGTYFVKESEANRLRDENKNLLAQQATLTADNEAALTQVRANTAELERAKKDASDAIRLRGEVAQLRRQQADVQRAAQKNSTAKATAEPPAKTSNLFTRDQMAHAGYATPESALQTIIWATMSSNLTRQQIDEGLAPDLINDKEAYALFERNRRQSVQVFQSVEMLAKKSLAEDQMEFKITLNIADPRGGQSPPPPQTMVLPMKRIASEWKLAGHPKPYEPKWDAEGPVQTYAP